MALVKLCDVCSNRSDVLNELPLDWWHIVLDHRIPVESGDVSIGARGDRFVKAVDLEVCKSCGEELEAKLLAGVGQMMKALDR
jgi:hypothetical protein